MTERREDEGEGAKRGGDGGEGIRRVAEDTDKEEEEEVQPSVPSAWMDRGLLLLF